MTPVSAETFLLRLHEQGRGGKRIPADEYWKIFGRLCSALSPPEARAKLAGWLNLLAETDDLRLPKGKRLYDRSDSGDLPVWIELVRPDEEREPLPVAPESYAWAPELRFACEERSPRRLRVLLQIQRFLAEGGRKRPFVPAKERSIELFGNEKRLEMMKGSALFKSGAVSYELLRCFAVPPPLIWEAPKDQSLSRAILALENHSTYHSFARWNRERACFAAIAYGNGDAFKSCASGISEIVPAVNWDDRLFYFGDLDPEGLLIPLAASATLATLEMPALQPHKGCYQRLLKRAKTADLPAGAPLTLSQECGTWLGEGPAAETQSWFAKGIRLAQELVGWEELQKDGHEFARA